MTVDFSQGYLFLIFILVGIIIGLLFDFFRILRRTFKTSDFITYIQDILFWILSGIILIYAIFIFNNGELRAYIFLSIFIGIITYMLTISKYFIKFNVMILSGIKKVIIAIFKIIIYPIKMILKLLKIIFIKPLNFIKNGFKNIMSKFAEVSHKLSICKKKMQKIK